MSKDKITFIIIIIITFSLVLGGITLGLHISKHKNEVIDYEIRNLKAIGFIKDEADERETRKKLESVAKDNLQNYHNRNLLLSKKYQKGLIKNDKK